METQELKEKINVIRTQAILEIQYIQAKARNEEKEVLDIWAKENARFNVGDIIESRGVILRVHKIKGELGGRSIPYVYYTGPVLTKKLRERKDCSQSTIWDDTPDRNIIKIK